MKTTTSTHLDIASTQFIRSIIGKIYLCNFPGFLHFLYCKVQHKPNQQRTWSVYIIEEPTVICCDNMSIIAMTKNPIFHARKSSLRLGTILFDTRLVRRNPTTIHSYQWSAIRCSHQSSYIWQYGVVQEAIKDYKLRGGVRINL